MAQTALGPAGAEGPCPTRPRSPARPARLVYPARLVRPVGPVHPVDEEPAPSRLAPAALQRIAAMYAGVVTPPLVIDRAVGLAAPGPYAGFPSWAQTVLGSGISAGALVAVLPTLFLHPLGTHGRTAVALKSS